MTSSEVSSAKILLFEFRRQFFSEMGFISYVRSKICNFKCLQTSIICEENQTSM
ncbi:hypothetical protein POPTR_004G188250v4 [Populus trichocarpa]|uniref:Uncharacterized protein n=1 Tax=Populus trichocarpa TaxID=3694 RepID=A0ACC0T5H1_POPTR|nr:hypothetical protein POPTR_004G188250v4 [Populus trichocarpa]